MDQLLAIIARAERVDTPQRCLICKLRWHWLAQGGSLLHGPVPISCGRACAVLVPVVLCVGVIRLCGSQAHCLFVLQTLTGQ